ncbi:DUF4031 domain-containing protein [Enemella evansiae]|uniref:DUF4031 domain-containing protein n=1 Tax=Enemella evansiae TaxID=2016499 RepID=UPI001061E9AA|nr:DUF4031 domain-containing protein [Enemella evansiae]TDO86169.1 putative metal-dependent HD superfamily phosphohydrolase [Enemella evansiae]
MTVLIDPPLWPAHQTVFSHLVSDTSLAELHEVAEAAGLPPRAFDRDHYDVPEWKYADCLAAGAVAVSARELVTALRASGLRRTKAVVRAETVARKEMLLDRWPLEGASEVAVELLDRWSARGRYYHDLRHLEHCLDSLALVAGPGGAGPVVEAAVWFHDAVYAGRAGQDEEESAVLAETRLAGVLPAAEIAEVARLVRLTAGHSPAAGDERGELLCDADLAILGAEAERYETYRRDVRREYADLPLPDFRKGRAQVLEHLLALDPLYRTEAGAQLWSAAARWNLSAELASLGNVG